MGVVNWSRTFDFSPSATTCLNIYKGEKTMKKLALHWQIIIGMVAGILLGVVAVQLEWGPQFVIDFIKPFGSIFIDVLKMIAMPLIIASLIKGISDLQDISSLSILGKRTVGIYLVTTVFAVTIGLTIVNIVQPGKTVAPETREQLEQAYMEDANRTRQLAEQARDAGPLQPLEDLFAENIFSAAADNGNMLQVIVVAIFFGIGLVLLPEKKVSTVKKFFDGLNEVILKLIDLIMLTAPYGVGALLAALVVESPTVDIFIALLWYAFCVVLGLSILIFIFYPLIMYLFTGKGYGFFFRGISPAQLVAFSTSSSAATLPVTMERTEEHLGVDREVTSFVLPIGATINMDGTSLYQAIAAIFIAQAFGMELSLAAQLGIVLTATLASIGSAAVPSAGMVMLVIVLAQAGIPEAGLALIFAVDRPLDMCRTVANVTGDATVSMLVAKSVDKLGDPQVKEWDEYYKHRKEEGTEEI